MTPQEAHDAATAHIETLPEEHKSYAQTYWEWIAKGQPGKQPILPDGISEDEGEAHRVKFGEIYHAGQWEHKEQ